MDGHVWGVDINNGNLFILIYWIDTSGPLGNESSNDVQQVTRSRVMMSYGNELSLIMATRWNQVSDNDDRISDNESIKNKGNE
jgi:hypothetical protein